LKALSVKKRSSLAAVRAYLVIIPVEVIAGGVSTAVIYPVISHGDFTDKPIVAQLRSIFAILVYLIEPSQCMPTVFAVVQVAVFNNYRLKPVDWQTTESRNEAKAF